MTLKSAKIIKQMLKNIAFVFKNLYLSEWKLNVFLIDLKNKSRKDQLKYIVFVFFL